MLVAFWPYNLLFICCVVLWGLSRRFGSVKVFGLLFCCFCIFGRSSGQFGSVRLGLFHYFAILLF